MKALFLCSLFLPSTGTYFLNELKNDLAVLSIGLESRRFCGVSAALKILLKVSMLKESGRLPLPCTCWVLKPSLEHTVASPGEDFPRRKGIALQHQLPPAGYRSAGSKAALHSFAVQPWSTWSENPSGTYGVEGGGTA